MSLLSEETATLDFKFLRTEDCVSLDICSLVWPQGLTWASEDSVSPFWLNPSFRIDINSQFKKTDPFFSSRIMTL